jgi:hypothetical protein
MFDILTASAEAAGFWVLAPGSGFDEVCSKRA